MRAKPRSLRLRRALIPFLLVGAFEAYGQGTVLVDLNGLPSGQTLAEQFAGVGVHFIARGAPPVTDVAPDFLPSGAGTVGRARTFGIRFDQPITLLEFDIAQAHETPNPLPHFPYYVLYAFDSSGREIGVPSGGSFPEEQWHHARATYSADTGITSIRLEGWVSAGKGFTHEIFFDNIGVTFVPEPGTISLFALGAAGLLSFLTRKGAGSKPGNM